MLQASRGGAPAPSWLHPAMARPRRPWMGSLRHRTGLPRQGERGWCRHRVPARCGAVCALAAGRGQQGAPHNTLIAHFRSMYRHACLSGRTSCAQVHACVGWMHACVCACARASQLANRWMERPVASTNRLAYIQGRAAQPSKTLGPSSSPSPCCIASHNDDGASHPSLPRPESDEPLEAQTSAASAVAGSARRVAGTEPGLTTDMATDKQEGRGMELTWHRRVKPKLQGRTAFAHMDEHV